MNFKEAIKYLQQDEGHRVKCKLGIFKIVLKQLNGGWGGAPDYVLYCDGFEFDMLDNAPEIVNQYFEIL